MPMTIDILREQRITVPDMGLDHREVKIRITDGTDTYLHAVGGLPVTGDLQTMLDNNADRVWADAQAKGRLITDTDLLLALLDRVGFEASYIALVRLFTGEINKLRTQAGLPTYTRDQVENALIQALIDEVAGG